MHELEYSDEALNARSAFFRVKSIVYVEGDDDVMFWSEVFSKVPGFSCEFEQTGGSSELDKIIDKIASGNLNAIAARDSDLLGFLGKKISNPRVLYTYGYAIENSIYTPSAIQAIARTWCKDPGIAINECQEWVLATSRELRKLLTLEIANEIGNCGVSVLGDNCSKFMEGKDLPTVCPDKVEAYYQDLVAKLPVALVQQADTHVGNDLGRVWDFIRGHFIASAIIRFIARRAKVVGRKISVSHDALYANAILYFGKVISKHHPHSDYYHNAALKAVANT